MVDLVRIYDQTAGQLAGYVVTSVQKATPNNDGTQALAQVVVLVDPSGVPVTGFAVTIADGADVAQGSRADTAYAGSGNATVISALKAIANSALSATPTTVNLTQINGITGLAGNGVTGTGSQRVTIASDNTAFNVVANGGGTAGTANAGVLSVQGIASMTPVLVAGPTASDAPLTVAPQTVGGRASAAAPTAVSTDGDVVNAWFTLTGKQIVIGAVRTLKKVQQTQLSATTSEITIVTAGAAGVFNDLYGLVLANTGATTTKVSIRDATSGTVITIFEVPTLETRGFMTSVDSGMSQTTAANNWTAQCASATTALEVTALYAVNVA